MSDELQRAIEPFFWERLSRRAAAVVEGNAVRIRRELEAHAAWAPLNCDLASAKWLDAFRAAGVPASLRGGNYDPGHVDGAAHPASTDHTWLRVDRAIFDPTAGQFAGAIDPTAYFDDELPHQHHC